MKKIIVISSIVAFTVIICVLIAYIFEKESKLNTGTQINSLIYTTNKSSSSSTKSVSSNSKSENNTSSTDAVPVFFNEEIINEKAGKIIEIKGAVLYPGVYVFYQEEVTAYNVILRAGGLLNTADTSDMNLAALVSNHSSIVVGSYINNTKSYVIGSDKSNELININTASKEELMRLPGIGETIAKDIIAYRKNGFFVTKEEIMKVNRIKENVFEQIKDLITV